MKRIEEVVDITTASTELYKLFRSECLEELYIVRICSSLKEKHFLNAYKSSCEGMHEQCIKRGTNCIMIPVLYYSPPLESHCACVVKLNINCHKET